VLLLIARDQFTTRHRENFTFSVNSDTD